MSKPTCPHCGVGIGEHGAGRCLDKWVAETVMGWKWMPTPDPEGQHYCWVKDGCEIGDFEPSSDISAAWEVVEKMAERCGIFVMKVRPGQDCVAWIHLSGADYTANADSLPLAICRAAVLAANEKENDDGTK